MRHPGRAGTPLPPVAPEKAGFSREGLARIDAFFAREIDANRVPGAVVAIARDGRLFHYKACGYLDKGARLAKPLPKDPLTGKDQRILALVKPLKFHCGGSCAFRTVGDYLRFAQMPLGGGAIGGRRAP